MRQQLSVPNFAVAAPILTQNWRGMPYHATAVESDRHLIQCIVYIDLNMVRAGAVTHPSEWIFSGYNEIQKPRQRYALIDYRRLMELMHVGSTNDLRESHKKWVEKSLRSENHFRESKWTGSIAVGSKQFVEKIKYTYQKSV